MDKVNKPDHYMVGGCEAIDVIKAKLTREEFIGYCKGNVLKYTMRSNYKGDHDTHLRKAEYYIREAVDACHDKEAAYATTQEIPERPF